MANSTISSSRKISIPVAKPLSSLTSKKCNIYYILRKFFQFLLHSILLSSLGAKNRKQHNLSNKLTTGKKKQTHSYSFKILISFFFSSKKIGFLKTRRLLRWCQNFINYFTRYAWTASPLHLKLISPINSKSLREPFYQTVLKCL